MKLNSLKLTDTERQHRPLVLEPSNLALNGGAALLRPPSTSVRLMTPSAPAGVVGRAQDGHGDDRDLEHQGYLHG